MSDEVREGYKRTEAGLIPLDWKARPLLNAIRIASGQVDPKVEPYKSMVLVAPDHIESTTGRLLKQQTAADQGAISGKYLFEEGDVVYSKIRPYLRKAILAKFDGLCSADMYPLRAAKDVSAGFMLSVLLGRHFSEYAESVSVRSGMPKVNRTELAEYVVALPPTKVEQEAIAEALSDTDSVIESLEQLIAKKRHIKQGAMQELLRAKDDWVPKRVGDLLTVAHGKSQHAVVDPNGAHPILASGGKIGTANRFLYGEPSVLIGRKGTIDRPQYMDQPFWTVDTLFYSIIHSPNVPKYLFYQFCLIDWMQYNEASGVPSLNARTIEAIELKVPQPEEQTAIATILSDMDAELSALEAKLTKTRQIKQGMMRELLTGRIRLV